MMSFRVFLFSLFLAPALVWGADEKIAVVDIDRAILTTEVAEKRFDQLKKTDYYSRQKDLVEKLQEERSDLVERIRKDEDTLSDAERINRQRQISLLNSDLEYQAKKLKTMEQEVYQQLTGAMRARAGEILKDLIKSEGIGLLLIPNRQNPIIGHVDSSFDLTAKLTDELNRSE